MQAKLSSEESSHDVRNKVSDNSILLVESFKMKSPQLFRNSLYMLETSYVSSSEGDAFQENKHANLPSNIVSGEGSSSSEVEIQREASVPITVLHRLGAERRQQIWIAGSESDDEVEKQERVQQRFKSALQDMKNLKISGGNIFKNDAEVSASTLVELSADNKSDKKPSPRYRTSTPLVCVADVDREPAVAPALPDHSAASESICMMRKRKLCSVLE